MKPQTSKYKAPEKTSPKGKVQPKLKVSTPGDAYEREADAMAEHVMRKNENSGIIARSLQQQGNFEKSKRNNTTIRRKLSDDGGVTVAPDMASRLTTDRENGMPLSDDTRSFMEHAFSRDFSRVRIHTDQQAASMSRDIHAKAFTYGEDIYFNQGQFSPETPEGKNLLAHELTHVVQQEEDTASPDVARAVELRPPGKGEASAFDRVQELIDKLNEQSPAIKYRLDGNRLLPDVKDEAALTTFDWQVRSYLEADAMVPFRLITGKGRVPKSATTLGRLTFDQFITGYVDLEDLLSTDRLAFQSIFVHILAERFGSPNYARRIGSNTFTGKEVRATHEMGHQAQAFHFQGVFHDPSIQFIYEEPKPGNKSHIVFRSGDKKYEVFVIVSRLNQDISHAEVRVRDADHQWYTADEFLARQAASAPPPAPAVQPQLLKGQQRSADEMKAVEKAKAIIENSGPEVKGPVMRKINSGSSIALTGDWVDQLAASGTGGPLPERSRRFMEGSFQADFSNVRIHTGTMAAYLSEQIHAKAFTYNGAIYFNRGEFSPDSQEGKRLLAHELTHILQQRGERIHSMCSGTPVNTASPGVIFRAPKKAGDSDDDNEEPEPTFENKIGVIDLSGNKHVIRLKKIKYSTVKYNKLEEKRRSNLTLNKELRPDNQRDLWRKEGAEDKVKKGLEGKVDQVAKKLGATMEEEGKTFYFFRLKKGVRKFLIGTRDEIVDSIILPRWNKQAQSSFYHVDHILEWQVAGGLTDKQRHSDANFWLWQSEANVSGGRNLSNEIKTNIHQLIENAVAKGALWKGKNPKLKDKFIEDTYKDFLSKTSTSTVKIDALAKALPISGSEDDHYDVEEIFADAKPLDNLDDMSEAQINSLKGNQKELSIMIGNMVIGQPLKIKNNFTGAGITWIDGFTITAVLEYNADAKPGERYAVLQGELFRELTKKNLFKLTILEIPVYRIGGPKYFGKIRDGFRERVVASLELPLSSPIEMQDAFFSKRKEDEKSEAILKGVVKPSISMLKGLEFDVTYAGDDITISKTFVSEDLKGKLPKPFDITNAEITLSASMKKGFGVDGQVDFEIQNVGKGFIKGEKKGVFSLAGGFEFEKGFFDKSGITVGYTKEPGDEEGKFSFHGFAEKSKESKGTFKKARIDVNYENNVLTARGEAETTLPGISKGTIEVITGNGATSIVADFVIGDSIPGVKGGNLHFLFTKDAEGKYLIEASSDINTKFPGIPHVKLHGFYNSDGVFLFEGDAELHLGRFNGTVHFGITNQEVDEHGQLTGKKGDKLVAFGKGDVNFKMTDWLSGKIGAEITPDARVILSGALIPDPHLAITKQKDPLHKDFGNFHLPRFTLFGIPHIADVYVTASGGFFLDAGIGPLYLNDAILEFKELDIEAPERTIVHGAGKLDLPAFAQLGVQVTITAGVGIVVVDVSINLTGSLAFAITGNAGFQMAFTWSVGTGLRIEEAMATLKAQTALIAKLGGKLLVKLDLFFTEIELYERPFSIGEKKWPLGLDLDVKFPLGFDGGEAGSFKLPDPNAIKHEDPKVDEETVKKGAMEEPPDTTPAPGKEESLARTRILPADATATSWIQRLYERYSYVDGLKKKYPDIDWTYLDVELKALDLKEFNNLSDKLLYSPGFPRTDFGKNLRLAALANFEEEHRYVNYSEAARLRTMIEQMKEED